MKSLAILQWGTAPESREQQLQTRLNCALLAEDSGEFEFLLQYRPQGLTLFSTGPGAPGGLYVDFRDGALQRRRKQGLRSQDLGKAVGLKHGSEQTILDATAGLGSDAFLLASSGCQLILLERSPVVAALLADGLFRAGQAGGELAAIAARMRLRQADFLVESDLPEVDVVFLDPMFPKDRKTAKSKKNMTLLQQLLGQANDSQLLLQRAKSLARRRVVVKRARQSPLLDDSSPDIQFRGSSSRYDVYLNQ